mmetsp:Transcript_87796/g.268646  ORF Transcript_87796/g.268646 Transcript_87796/m.268646 type:complete len:231 (+) Transcript_87796:112-804(+)
MPATARWPRCCRSCGAWTMKASSSSPRTRSPRACSAPRAPRASPSSRTSGTRRQGSGTSTRACGRSASRSGHGRPPRWASSCAAGAAGSSWRSTSGPREGRRLQRSPRTHATRGCPCSRLTGSCACTSSVLTVGPWTCSPSTKCPETTACRSSLARGSCCGRTACRTPLCRRAKATLPGASSFRTSTIMSTGGSCASFRAFPSRRNSIHGSSIRCGGLRKRVRARRSWRP